ncbi:MAG: ATP synthase F1 subunit delta [Legionellales bacterium]|nr:ATP synthase F1 subunit delta [Legionellales bacterium]
MINQIARPYATAIAMLIDKENEQQKWFKALNALESVLNQALIQTLIGDPRISNEVRLQGLQCALKESGFPAFWRLLDVLLENKRFHSIPAIIRILQELLAKKFNMAFANVRIPEQPTKAIEKKIRQWVSHHCQADHVQLSWQLEPEVLGGLIIEVNGQQLDRSLFGRLDKVKQSLGVESCH